MSTPVWKLHGLCKSFDGVTALHPIDAEFAPGEIVGLIGENGAGKSTLIKLLSGVHHPDAGQILRNGNPMELSSPHDALAVGIATIHQELEYLAHLTVAENMLLGERWPRTWCGGVDWRTLHEQARSELQSFGLEMDTHRRMVELTAVQKQEIAIARAVSGAAQLLILDEPTASLTEPEVRRLFVHLRKLRQRGSSLVYVSHRLDEIMAVTDRVLVLRDGRLVAGHTTSQVQVSALVRDMVGRPLDQIYPRTRSGRTGRVMLRLENATCEKSFHDITLQVREGEILGLTGLVGSGRSELARAIFGHYPLDHGSMTLAGKPWTPSSPHDSLKAGLVYLPEERKRQGFVLDHSVRDSISIGFSDLLTRWGIVSRKSESIRVQHVLSGYDIRSRSPRQPIGTLSGGNQQKALLGRWLERDPQVIILDEPTRGVDVGAKLEIHAVMDRLAANGKTVLLISSDLPEVLGMSDRILVMDRGGISAELSGDDMTEHHIILAASGLYPSEDCHAASKKSPE